MESNIQAKPYSVSQIEDMEEAEIEQYIESHNSGQARFILARLLIEGTSDKINKNLIKGINWLKESIKNGNMEAIEYKVYYDIRFDRQPKLKKIQDTLLQIVEKTKSVRACNTVGEFYQIQDKLEGGKELAARYFGMSAEQGCQLGIHWLGVFYHLAFGLSKNVQKAIELLSVSAKQGNAQSLYQLYVIYTNEEQFKDAIKAYKCLEKALFNGITYFDELHNHFKENYDILAQMFIDAKKPQQKVTIENKVEVINLHEAYVNEMKNSFSNALNKDRLYFRPAGFVQDTQIWMIGVLKKYLITKVIRFNHNDFIKAMKIDLGPLLGEVGIWAITHYCNRKKEKGQTEKRKQGQVALDLIKSYMEQGFDYIGKENKYYFINKYGPKKCPTEQILRENVQHVYSWSHYAHQSWFDHIKKVEDEIKANNDKKLNPAKKCEFCSAPESDTRKHKFCSACKQVFYCSTDCQKYDWQKKHKTECKTFQATNKAKGK